MTMFPLAVAMFLEKTARRGGKVRISFSLLIGVVPTRLMPAVGLGMTRKLTLSMMALVVAPLNRMPRSLPKCSAWVVSSGTKVKVTVAKEPSLGALPVALASRMLPAGVLRQSLRMAPSSKAMSWAV